MSARRGAGLLLDLPVLGALGFILYLLARTIGPRFGYPYDLEWMEGGMLTHAWRVTQGEPLYVTPSADFVPFIYPPLYHYLVALTGLLTGGLDYQDGRLLSLLGTAAATVALVVAVVKEGGRWSLGLGAAALYLSAYDDTGAFYDLVRIDGLFMALFAWSLLALRHGWLRSGGLLLTAAFATKHNGALLGVVPLVWLWKTEGRAVALRYAAWSVGPALAFTGLMMLEGDHLFLDYVVGAPSHHGFVAARFFPQAEGELVAPVLLPLAAAIGLALGLSTWRGIGRGAAYWLGQGAVSVLLCAMMRGHQGGFTNVLMPGIWALSLLTALGLSRALQARPHALLHLALGLLLAGQVYRGRWEEKKYLPTPADLSAGARVVADIAAVKGEALAPWSPWYPVLAGKAPGLHLIGLWDIDHKGSSLRPAVKDIEAELAARRWAVIVAANDKLGHGVNKAYEKGKKLSVPGAALYPKTGWRVRPTFFYTPRRDLDPSAPNPDDGPGGDEADP